MWKTIRFFLVILFSLALLAPTFPAQADAPTVSDIIAAVNNLRQSHGLPPLTVNVQLTNAAQGQSDYQASIGTWSHTGAGGSTWTSRAIAAGYGGGKNITVLENVAEVSELGTVDFIMNTVWADSIHQATMLQTKATDVGCAVAVSNGNYYYTLDVGYVGKGNLPTVAPTSASNNSSNSAQTPKPSSPDVTSVPPNNSIIVSTPADNGSITHIVGNGQTLINIAQAYGVTVAQIQALNQLSGSIIYVNQKLVIRLAFTPTISPTITLTPVPPTRTSSPTSTPVTPTATRAYTTTPTPTPTPDAPVSGGFTIDRRFLGIGLIAVGVVGLALVAFGSLLRRTGASGK